MFIKGCSKKKRMNLNSRLECVKDLKERYGIGALAAHHYLKAQDAYARLQALVRDQTGVFVTERGLANICDRVANTIAARIELKVVESADETDRQAHTQIILPFYESTLLGYFDRIEKDDHKNMNLWTLNYVEFAIAFGEELGHRRPSEALHVALRTTENRKLLSQRGARVSLREFIRGDVTDDFLYSREDENEIGELLTGISVDEARSNYEEQKKRNKTCSLDSITHEDVTFLMGGSRGADLYERAKAEHTLKTERSERRIALNTIGIRGYVHGLSHQNAHELIDEVLKIEKKGREKLLLRSQIAGDILGGYDTKIIKRLIEKLNYTIAAVVKNREWLAKTLSS